MKEKVAKLLLPRGSYGDDWYDHWGDCGGGGGWWTGSPGSPDNPYELPEVIVTPSGNHVDYSNSDFDYNYGNGYYGDENSYLWHQDGNYDDRNDGGGGGGDSSDYYDSTEANILSHGQTAVNVILTVFKTIPLYGVSMFKRRRVFSYFLRPRLQVEFRISSMT